MAMSEFVYILSNPSMPGLLKIGYTAKTVEERMRELQTTGVPKPFKLEFKIETDNGILLESHLHKTFRQYREGSDREFFRIPLLDVIKRIKEDIQLGVISYIYFGGVAGALYLTPAEKKKIEDEKAELDKEKKERAEIRRQRAEIKKQQVEAAERSRLVAQEKWRNILFLEKEIAKYLDWLNRYIEAKRKKESLLTLIFSSGTDCRIEGVGIARAMDLDSRNAVAHLRKKLHDLVVLGEYENSLKKILVDSNKLSKNLENVLLFERKVISSFQNNEFRLKGWHQILLGILSELKLSVDFPPFKADSVFYTKSFYRELRHKRHKTYFQLLEEST